MIFFLGILEIENTSVSASNPFSDDQSVSNSSIVIDDPVIYKKLLNVTDINNTDFEIDFVSYEDFPIYIGSDLKVDDVKIINKPEGAWAKIIHNSSLQNQTDADAFLRIAGLLNHLYLLISILLYTLSTWMIISY